MSANTDNTTTPGNGAITGPGGSPSSTSQVQVPPLNMVPLAGFPVSVSPTSTRPPMRSSQGQFR